MRDYQRTLAPEPRRALKAAILGLAHGRGDTKPLEDNLAGYYRLRVGTHRVVYRHVLDGSIVCVYAAARSIVYEVMAARLRDFIDPQD